MNRFSALLGILLLLAACGEAPTEGGASGTTPDEPMVSFFSGTRVIPGDGSEPNEDAIFVTNAGKITQIGNVGAFTPPGGSARIPLNERTGTAKATVIPGLINLEAYPGLTNGPTFTAQNYNRDNFTADLKRYEYYGVFAVASGGANVGDLQYEIRDEQRQGTDGALYFTPGQGITARGGYPANALEGVALEVASADEGRKAVTDLVAKKVDFIKIFVNGTPKLSPAVYTAVIDEAKKNNLKVVADAPALADAKALVDAGVNGLVNSVTEGAVDDALIASMKEKNVFLAPALTALEAKFIYADQPKWLSEQFLSEAYVVQLLGYLRDPVTVNRFRRERTLPQLRTQFNTAKQNLKRLADGGVKIALGTGSGLSATFPGFFEHRELELMVDAGLTPADAIKTSTVSAEFLGLADWGTLAEGKIGNFLVLTDNPLTDITKTRTAQQVYRDGAQVEQKALIEGITINIPRISQARIVQPMTGPTEMKLKGAGLKTCPSSGPGRAGDSVRIRAMAIPTPLGARASAQPGPPDRITVTYSGTAAQWRAFYGAALQGWRAAGQCWERNHPINTAKVETLCVEAGGSSAVVNITER